MLKNMAETIGELTQAQKIKVKLDTIQFYEYRLTESDKSGYDDFNRMMKLTEEFLTIKK